MKTVNFPNAYQPGGPAYNQLISSSPVPLERIPKDPHEFINHMFPGGGWLCIGTGFWDCRTEKASFFKDLSPAKLKELRCAAFRLHAPADIFINCQPYALPGGWNPGAQWHQRVIYWNPEN